jgi:hypothetical protein
MRWNNLGLIVGLAGALMSTRTFALPENSLLANAQAIIPLNLGAQGSGFFWQNTRTLMVWTNGEEFQIDRRTLRRKLLSRFNPSGDTVRAIEDPPSRPNWLPPHAKIVGFDSGFRAQEAHREAWIVAWPVRGKAEARYGVWVTGPNGTMPHLLGVAPLTRHEFDALTRNYDFLFSPDDKEVGFVYRGMLYVLPVLAKPVPV